MVWEDKVMEFKMDSLSPPQDLIDTVCEEIQLLPTGELDQMYARFWQWYTSIEDYDNLQADQLLATIYALEEVRQYTKQQCQKLRQDIRPRVV